MFSFVHTLKFLLKREEVETLKVSGKSIIAAVHHNKGEGRKTFCICFFLFNFEILRIVKAFPGQVRLRETFVK